MLTIHTAHEFFNVRQELYNALCLVASYAVFMLLSLSYTHGKQITLSDLNIKWHTRINKSGLISSEFSLTWAQCWQEMKPLYSRRDKRRLLHGDSGTEDPCPGDILSARLPVPSSTTAPTTALSTLERDKFGDIKLVSWECSKPALPVSWEWSNPALSLLWEWSNAALPVSWEWSNPALSVSWEWSNPALSLSWEWNNPALSVSWEWSNLALSLSWEWNNPALSLSWEWNNPALSVSWEWSNLALSLSWEWNNPALSVSWEWSNLALSVSWEWSNPALSVSWE